MAGPDVLEGGARRRCKGEFAVSDPRFDLFAGQPRMVREFGWVSYTLSRSERFLPGGPHSLFSFDQPHVLNVAVSYKTGGWRFGTRFLFARQLDNEKARIEPFALASWRDPVRPIHELANVQAEVFVDEQLYETLG